MMFPHLCGTQNTHRLFWLPSWEVVQKLLSNCHQFIPLTWVLITQPLSGSCVFINSYRIIKESKKTRTPNEPIMLAFANRKRYLGVQYCAQNPWNYTISRQLNHPSAGEALITAMHQQIFRDPWKPSKDTKGITELELVRDCWHSNEHTFSP